MFNPDVKAGRATLVIFSGIPGSGKSTLAAKLLEELRADGTRSMIVNRDEIRTMLFGEDYHKSAPVPLLEGDVSQMQRKLIRHGLERGWTIISDDTNISAATVKNLRKFAESFDAFIVEQPVVVDVDVALERNRKRGEAGGRFVPEEIIRSMDEKFKSSLRSKGLL